MLAQGQSLIKPDDDVTNTDHVTKLVKVSGCHLTPVINVIGGIMSHEVIKCLTNKGTPIDQVLFYDAAKCLPSLNEHDVKLVSVCTY